jgi:hypothetical protein
MQRFHPVQHRWKTHKGTDYAATGTPITTTASVVENRIHGWKWNYVKKHNGTYSTQYLHMSKYLVRREGVSIKVTSLVEWEALDLRLGHMYVIVLEKQSTSRCA